MIKFIIYLLESSAILAAFYLLYVVLMKKETFFSFNRFFLIGIVIFSLLLPFMSFNFSQSNITVIDSSVEKFNKFRASYYENAETWEYESTKAPILQETSTTKVIETSTSIDWTTLLWKSIIWIYIAGDIVLCGIWKFCNAKVYHVL